MCSCSFKFSIQRAGEGLGILNDKVKNSRGGEREKKRTNLSNFGFYIKTQAVSNSGSHIKSYSLK